MGLDVLHQLGPGRCAPTPLRRFPGRYQPGEVMVGLMADAQADAAMYAAGGSGYAVFDPAAHSALRTRQQLERDLREALSHDQLRLEYQR